QKTLREQMDIALEELQFASELERMTLCFCERQTWPLREGSWVKKSGNGMNQALKDGLLVPRDAQERLEDPGRVRVETHDFALARTILKVNPSASFEASRQPPRK